MTSVYETAAVLGVEFETPLGEIRVHGEWFEAGTVVATDDGAVRVIPRSGLDENSRDELLGMAIQVAIQGPGRPPAWRYAVGLGWVACVQLRHRSEQELRMRKFAFEVLNAFGQRPRDCRAHLDFYLDIGRRCSLTDTEIGQCLGMSEDEVRRELAAGGQ
ncbi:hypothetical protein [Nocardia sp. CA-290969]|uniref:hypothetical protein n=1 Tax=Nocardia sp. CA-290969 TaxID=3239986 RepID=UPI003D907B61